MSHYEKDRKQIEAVKNYFWEQLKTTRPDIVLNSDEPDRCLYTVLNVAIPKTDKSEMLLMNLDMAGVCVSGGSACSSGANNISHVIKSLHPENAEHMIPIRFSFSKHNTKEEVDTVIELLQKFL